MRCNVFLMLKFISVLPIIWEISKHDVIIPYQPIFTVSIICQVVAYRGLKTNKKNVRLLALKMVAVARERWSLTRGSKYTDLTWKHLLCVKNWSQRRGGCIQEVVATRGSTVFFIFPNFHSCFYQKIRSRAWDYNYHT